jgi:hypothetical protein
VSDALHPHVMLIATTQLSPHPSSAYLIPPAIFDLSTCGDPVDIVWEADAHDAREGKSRQHQRDAPGLREHHAREGHHLDVPGNRARLDAVWRGAAAARDARVHPQGLAPARDAPTRSPSCASATCPRTRRRPWASSASASPWAASHCAKILSSMYAALNSDPSDPDVIIKLDISNAFNVLCRHDDRPFIVLTETKLKSNP